MKIWYVDSETRESKERDMTPDEVAQWQREIESQVSLILEEPTE
jgi:hypothetical protein